MVYGARLFDATRNFVIRDAEFSTNLEKHFKKCVFGDVMLYQKSLTVLAQSKDLWADIGPGSEARSQEWLERQGDGTVTSAIVTCRQAYDMLNAQWAPMIEANTPFWGRSSTRS
jgi:conjugal transfer mating pair stabilization protein TraG